MKLSVLLCSISCVLLLQQATCLYFYLEEGQKKCFLEDFPSGTVHVVHFEAFPTVNVENFGLLIEVVDPEGKMLYTKDGGVKGRFAFSTMISGEHSICYRTNTARWFAPKNQVKVVLSTSTNEEDVSQDELASQEEILELENAVRKLNDQVRNIRKQQAYQKAREIQWRDLSEVANTRVMWWSLIVCFICVAIGVWQIYHLKSFFKAKKLV